MSKTVIVTLARATARPWTASTRFLSRSAVASTAAHLVDVGAQI
jgi:hypothetical protein